MRLFSYLIENESDKEEIHRNADAPYRNRGDPGSETDPEEKIQAAHLQAVVDQMAERKAESLLCSSLFLESVLCRKEEIAYEADGVAQSICDCRVGEAEAQIITPIIDGSRQHPDDTEPQKLRREESFFKPG